jgi:hypothetical protein
MILACQNAFLELGQLKLNLGFEFYFAILLETEQR